MELKYKNWDQINLSKYLKLKKIVFDKDMSQVDKDAEVLSVLCDTDIDTVFKQKVFDIQKLIGDCAFLLKFPEPKKISLKNIVINGQKYDIVTKLENYTMNQFIDFKNFVQYGDEQIGYLLATFIIPKGHTYNNGYDLDYVVNEILEYLPAPIANSLIVFFSKKLMSYTDRTLDYSEILLRMTKTKLTKDKTKEGLSLIQRMRKLSKSLFG